MRKILTLMLVAACATVGATMPSPGEPGAPADPRYCGEPARDARGVIKRSQAVLKRFTAVFPCPATLAQSTACEGWAINHIIPLASGGCDAPVNLMWLPDAIKSCAGAVCVDRWERKYHAIPRQPVVIAPPANVVTPK